MKEKNKKRSWKQIVSILSCIVVFCTTYALILPAVTLSTDTFCGKEEHTHSEKCYRSETPLCGLEEGEGSEGHTHTEDCYGNVEVGRNLICGMEEVEGHVHDDSCYQSEFEYGLICGKEESEPTEGHVHNDDCYQSETPICGKEEHEHSHECYSNKEDVEDPKDWEEAYKDINKEEDAKKRILQVAKNEVGYKENEANFSVDENDAEHYYTRYGHLYEDMYGDWNNYFTGYVLKYANVKMNFDKDISKWQNKTIDDQKEEGEEGNVVFFRDDEGELRSGIVTKVDDLTKEIRVIEGDVDGQVKEERINRDKVIAYLSDEVTIEDEDTPLAGDGVEKEEQTITQTAKDAEETVEVTATYTEEANLEGTTLRVEYLQTLENGNVQYNIGFYDETGEEKEPAAPVDMSIKYLNDQLDGSEEVNYIHYKKDGSTEEINSKVEKLEDGSVESKFTAESFSVYETVVIDGVQKVEIEGLDKEYKIGDEVTLKAVTKNIENINELSYQWQYNDEDPENEEKWFNIPEANEKNYKFEVNYTNGYYAYRVIIGSEQDIQEKTKDKPNIAPSGDLQKRKLNLSTKFLNISEEESGDSSDNGLIVSEYDVPKVKIQIVAGVEFNDTKDPNKVLHTKSIEYLGTKEAEKRDDYRISITSGPISGENPVDLLFVVDTSGSMSGSISDVQKVIKEISKEFLACNTNNRVAMVTFASGASKKFGYTHSPTNYNLGSADGGTNYMAGLKRAYEVLETSNPDHKQVMIFISDGEPTYYLKNYNDPISNWKIDNSNLGGDGNTTEDYYDRKGNWVCTTTATNQAINTFKEYALTKSLNINTIYYGNNKTNSFLDNLSSSGKFISSSNTTALKDDLVLLSQGPTCTEGKMTDTLSEFVDFDSSNYEIVVKAYKGGKKEDPIGTEIFKSDRIEPNGEFINILVKNSTNWPWQGNNGRDVTLEGVSGNISVRDTIKPSVKIENKTITLSFDSQWKMDASFLYELSFNVYVNKTAYDEEGSSKGYIHTGAENTGITSAQQQGFNSNASGSFSFKFKGEDYSLPYDNPVVQIIRTDLTLTKMGNKNPLDGAEFNLYKKDDKAKPIDGHEKYNGTLIGNADKPIVSGTNGEINLTQLSVGTYYLFETKSPTGYTVAQEPWELTIEAKADRGNANKVQLYYSLKDLNKEEDKQIIAKDKLLNFELKDSSEIISHDRWKYFSETEIKIENEPGKSLPNTGGAGTKLFTFSGAAVIAASGLMYGYKKKKDKRNGKGGLRK